MSNYVINTCLSFLHARSRPRFLRDGLSTNGKDWTYTDVLVRSGDYMQTIASELDALSIMLAPTNDPERQQLDRLIEQLLYIDRTYKLVPRKPSQRDCEDSGSSSSGYLPY